MQDEDYDDDCQLTPRNHEEIGAAIDRLIDQVWYYRCYCNLTRDECTPDIWETAKKHAKRIRAEIDDLGPWDDLEWGMVLGKLSALRWVMGDDWDFLDT